MSDTQERRQDFESRDRLVKLEALTEQFHHDFNRFHDDMDKMGDNFLRHVDQNNESFTKINETLTKLTITLELATKAIDGHEKTARSIMDTQDKMLKQFNLIDMQKQTIDRLEQDQKVLQKDVLELKELKNEMKGTWKTLTIVASTIAFLISTAISIGAFQLGKSESTKTSYHISETRHV